MTVVSNYISNKTVGFDYKDPPWIKKNLLKTKCKNEIYKTYKKMVLLIKVFLNFKMQLVLLQKL